MVESANHSGREKGVSRENAPQDTIKTGNSSCEIRSRYSHNFIKVVKIKMTHGRFVSTTRISKGCQISVFQISSFTIAR